MTQDDPRRQVAAVEACLYKRLDAKHTLTPRATLLESVCAAMGMGSDGLARAALDRRLPSTPSPPPGMVTSLSALL